MHVDSWDLVTEVQRTTCKPHVTQKLLHMLYILSGAVAVPLAQFGPGIGIIHLDDVQCNGSESTLANCSHRGVGDHNCHLLEDAGVICSPGNAASNLE